MRAPGRLPPPATPPGTRALGGDTLLQTGIRVWPPFALNESGARPDAPTSGPMRIRLRAFGRSAAGHGRLIERAPGFARCPFNLRIYRTSGGDAPLWRARAADTGTLACPKPLPYSDSTDVRIEWDVPDVLAAA